MGFTDVSEPRLTIGNYSRAFIPTPTEPEIKTGKNTRDKKVIYQTRNEISAPSLDTYMKEIRKIRISDYKGNITFILTDYPHITTIDQYINNILPVIEHIPETDPNWILKLPR
ncbi:hypothetical protein [Xenorhabdus lircayensis]|uniref:Uncharacterized protein n=1 Tax=Xenorhabdus lircayensis TaxID=2763499 RepID=A0ABS0U0B8_9GAMM|nr:hypothetical protein [Xenorhabdus lircayensis]MBI6547316.1 hypothetical protein [Xenorhabdus lircayensis]